MNRAGVPRSAAIEAIVAGLTDGAYVGDCSTLPRATWCGML